MQETEFSLHDTTDLPILSKENLSNTEIEEQSISTEQFESIQPSKLQEVSNDEENEIVSECNKQEEVNQEEISANTSLEPSDIHLQIDDSLVPTSDLIEQEDEISEPAQESKVDENDTVS